MGAAYRHRRGVSGRFAAQTGKNHGAYDQSSLRGLRSARAADHESLRLAERPVPGVQARAAELLHIGTRPAREREALQKIILPLAWKALESARRAGRARHGPGWCDRGGLCRGHCAGRHGVVMTAEPLKDPARYHGAHARTQGQQLSQSSPGSRRDTRHETRRGGASQDNEPCLTWRQHPAYAIEGTWLPQNRRGWRRVRQAGSRPTMPQPARSALRLEA